MEQEERKDLDISTEDTPNPEPGDGKNEVQRSRDQTRRSFLHLLAGGYLLYLSWQLLSSFATGIGANGWTGDMLISLIGGAVFVLVGGYLLVIGLRRLFAELKDKNSQGG